MYTEFKQMIATIFKSNNSRYDSITRLIECYFKYIYSGHELPMVIERYYYPRLFWYILFAIGDQATYAQFNEENMRKFDNLMRKTIIESKINSFRDRQRLYFIWIGGENNYQGYDDILEYIWRIYPKFNNNNQEEVKELLGITSNIQSLNKKLSELKNVGR